jgi:hypothetical protein
MAAVSDEDVARGSIHFLKRDALYDLEKPYTIRYALPEGTLRTNSQHEEHHGLLIQNIRPQLQRFSMGSHGFTVVKMESAMMYQDFENEDRIINIYLAEVARKLRETLKARHVQVYEHTVSASAKHHLRRLFDHDKLRRRDAAYPISTGKKYAFDQPTNTAHIGKYIPAPRWDWTC